MPSDGKPYDLYIQHYNLFQCGHKRNCMHCPSMVALHDLEVKAVKVLNVYMMAPNCEKIWTVLGSEFGDNFWQSVVIVKELYGLQSEGASFRAHLAQCMQACHSCNAGPNLWMKALCRPEETLEYCSYILCYVDDILFIHQDPDDVLNKLNDMCH